MPPSKSAQPAAPDSPVTLVVARFDDVFARGLRGLLRGDPSLSILAEDVEQRRIGVVLRAHRPSVAILDAGSLVKLADVRELTVRYPSTRLVLLGNGLSSIECAQLLAFGAGACLGRDAQARDVLNAIHLASRGLQLAPRAPERDGRPGGAGGLLTRREAEVLALLQQRRSNRQIALALGIGVETVRTHARNIYRKLGVASRSQLTAARDRESDGRPSVAGLARRRLGSGGLSRPRRGHDARHP